MKVVGGSASTSLAKELARELSVPLVEVRFQKFPGGFPDGEGYVQLLDSVRGDDVVLVQTTHPDEKIIELFLLQDAIRDEGASRLTAVIPYFGYGRQDKKFEIGEAVSARALARHIQLQSDDVITVGIHNKKALEHFQIPCENVSGMPPLARYLRGRNVNIILAPDENASPLAKEVAEIIGCPWDFLEKERVDNFSVKIAPKNVEARGLSVAIVDDIISTGGTVAVATEHLKVMGARRVLAACLHGLFVANALDRLSECDEIISTDTIFNPTTKVSVAPEIARAIRERVGV